MEKKNINWGELGFSYQQTEKRFVANFKDGAWDECTLTEDATITPVSYTHLDRLRNISGNPEMIWVEERMGDMKYVAGVDIGNATTEVALAKIDEMCIRDRQLPGRTDRTLR